MCKMEPGNLRSLPTLTFHRRAMDGEGDESHGSLGGALGISELPPLYR